MNKEEILKLIRENLEIHTVSSDPYVDGNDIDVELRMKGDDTYFTFATVHIPDSDS